ncbi:MAG: GNAT family N-acetyltransferase [Patescibacteria group bacterium]
MENISLIRYSPDSNDYLLTAQLVECYRDVFADTPWNEWLKCSKCGKYWGVKDQGLLASLNFRHCDIPLVDFWSREQVLFDLRHEIISGSSCWLAMSNKTVVGFCWGYPINISDLETKLGVSFNTELEYNFGTSGLAAYQDEVGVLSAYRGRKIAKAMIIHRLNDFLTQGLQIGIVRTRQKPEPSETFMWYTQKLGYKILANYPNDDGRVILVRQLSGLKELLTS